MRPSVVVSRTLYLNLLFQRYVISQFVDDETVAVFQISQRIKAILWLRGGDSGKQGLW